MIIGLIPNLLAPLFVLQKRRRKKKKRREKEKIKRRKGGGKEEKGEFFVLRAVPGSPKCLPAKGAGSCSISQRVWWYPGRTRLWIGGCCSHGDGGRELRQRRNVTAWQGDIWGKCSGD